MFPPRNCVVTLHLFPLLRASSSPSSAKKSWKRGTIERTILTRFSDGLAPRRIYIYIYYTRQMYRYYERVMELRGWNGFVKCRTCLEQIEISGDLLLGIRTFSRRGEAWPKLVKNTVTTISFPSAWKRKKARVDVARGKSSFVKRRINRAPFFFYFTESRHAV